MNDFNSYFTIIINNKLLKKVWNITFALNFCTYSNLFTWVLHALKDCSLPYILQKNAWKSIRWKRNNSLPNPVCGLQKLIFLDAVLHWLHRCEKGVKCAVKLDQWWFLQLLILTPPLFNDVYLNNPCRFLSSFQSHAENWFLFLVLCQTCSRNNYLYKTFTLESDIPYFFWTVYITG